MKKILLVIDSLTCGGAEKSLISLLSLLDYSKNAVDLLLFKRGEVFEALLPKEVNIIKSLEYSKFMKLPLKQAILNSIRRFDFARLCARLKFTIDIRKYRGQIHGAQLLWRNASNVIERNPKEYDVAIGYSQGFPTYYVAEKVTAKKKVSWVNTNYVLAGYDKNYDYKFYHEMTKIIAVSNATKDILINVFPEFSKKMEVIYDINNPHVINKMAKNLEGYTDDFDGIRLLTVGRLVPPKGYEFAMEACKKLKDKGVNFRWYVVGEGILRSEITDYLKANNLQRDFILLGVKANPYPYMKDCDIYVQTSKFEGFGLSIAEAKILNKPIVTTKFNGVHDQINDGENGIVVDMNGSAICEGIVRMLTDDKLRNNIIAYLKTEKKGNVEEFKKFTKLVQSEV